MISLPRNKIAVRLIKDPDKIGSLYVPDVTKERSDQGIVKYVGSEVKDIKPGDYVVFSGWDGTVLILEGEGQLGIFYDYTIQCVIHPAATPIEGLYHLDENGFPFQATYESTIEMIHAQYSGFPRLANIRERVRKQDR